MGSWGGKRDCGVKGVGGGFVNVKKGKWRHREGMKMGGFVWERSMDSYAISIDGY